MKILSIVMALLLVVALGGAVTGWKTVGQLRAEKEALRAEIKTAKEQHAAATADEARKREYEVQKLKAEAQDVIRLRVEVTQLKQGGRDAEKLRAENQKLKSDGEKMRSAAAAAPVAATEVAKPEEAATQFPKSAWTFSGYATPESSIVSAMWAMAAGNPKTYFDSLTPAEQERMLKSWEGKSEQEIAAKQLADAARIDSLNIVGHQVVSPTEVWLTVTAPAPDGTTRTMLVPMVQGENGWKFDGFKRAAAGVPKTGTQGR